MKPHSAILEPAHARQLVFDGVPDADPCASDGSAALCGCTRPLTGGDYWCPPPAGDAVDLCAPG